MSEDEAPLVMSVPSMDRVAFVCPHCATLAQQRWFRSFLKGMDGGSYPSAPTAEWATHVRQKFSDHEDMLAYVDRRLSAAPKASKDEGYVSHEFTNVFISQCLACLGFAFWLRDGIIWPPQRAFAIQPNPDLPDDVRVDFMEAASIAHVSPRSAAALLRLAIEKICRHLGKTGTIDQMIGSLVADGLHTKLQKALDVVRVVGNESVHPGQMNIADDAGTVQTLFRLVNLIAETMITEPKRIDAIYDTLPSGKLEGIEARNAKALQGPAPK